MPEKIRVHKKNEVYLYIECEDRGIHAELNEYFSFYVPGYQFMPSFRNKFWDGKARLYNIQTHLLYGGLLPYLHEFADSRGAEIEMVNARDDRDIVRPDMLVDFVRDLKLHAHGKDITPRGYQLEAVYRTLVDGKRLLLSPTASGKSLIIYILIRWFLSQSDSKVLLVVPTTSLVEQMYSDFADYATNDDTWGVAESCHRIYSGKEKIGIEQRVIITTWQSIYKLPSSWFAPYGMVIGDEAHNFKAKSLAAIMEKLVNARYRVGTTGTLDGTQTHKLVLEGLFGPVYQVTTTRALMDSNTLAQLKLDVVLLKYADEECKAVNKLDYQGEIDYIVSHPARNKFIRNLALNQTGNTLVLYNYVEKHGKPLYDDIKKKLTELGSNRKLFFVSGGVETDERERIRALTEKETDAIIVASLGTFSTGINIRNLHNVIFASPSKSQIRVLQSIGRGLRKSDNGQATRVFDVADDFHWKKSRNYTLDHAAERIKIYSREKFDYSIHEVKF